MFKHIYLGTPPVDRQTDMIENMTFPHNTYADGNDPVSCKQMTL